jgi:hypothetical protein
LMGHRVFVDSKIDFGTVECGAHVSARIRVVNCGTNTLSIVGARKSCGCIDIESFPVAVRAGSSYPLEVSMSIPSQPAQFAYSVELYVAEEKTNLSPFSIALTGSATCK